MNSKIIISNKYNISGNQPVLVTRGKNSTQAIVKYIRDLRKVGYPVRNLITQLLRELIIMKAELDLGVDLSSKTKIRSKHRGGSTTRVGSSKTKTNRKIV